MQRSFFRHFEDELTTDSSKRRLARRKSPSCSASTKKRNKIVVKCGQDLIGGALQGKMENRGENRFLRSNFKMKMAERGGFEPPVRLPVRRFSKPLLSATQPPLRYIKLNRFFYHSVNSALYNICHFANIANLSWTFLAIFLNYFANDACNSASAASTWAV